jgi:hypothetical protein
MTKDEFLDILDEWQFGADEEDMTVEEWMADLDIYLEDNIVDFGDTTDE